MSQALDYQHDDVQSVRLFLTSFEDCLPDGMADEMLEILEDADELDDDTKDYLNEVCTSWGYPNIV